MRFLIDEKGTQHSIIIATPLGQISVASFPLTFTHINLSWSIIRVPVVSTKALSLQEHLV